ncbi:MAG TPA: EAL domain-containing protein, partial [Streptosporangiaceae bacterium]|nr:EAL domain-containing protein [Streptosporangiaceae bacterium]
PKVILESGRTAGMEALVRWQHPVRGLMAPEEFIPLVEQSYLMRDLTFQVVERTLAQAAAWRQDGLLVQVSLNVAARDLLDAGLAETIGRGLERYDLPPDALLLEINERVLTSEPAYAVTAVEALAALGVALSLDDFGTGYSSLVRLKRLPVSEVKIDSSFIGRLLDSADDEVIVQSIVDLVRALDIDSVAEGVESAEVAAALRVMGCKAAQGWYFSRPLNAASATAWLVEHAAQVKRPAPIPSGRGGVDQGLVLPPVAMPASGVPSARSVPASDGASPVGPVGPVGPVPPAGQPPAGLPSLWWQAVNGVGPPLRGR